VALLDERVDLRDHHAAERARGEGFQGQGVVVAVAARGLAHMPHLRLIDLAHRKAAQPFAGEDDAADLVGGRDLVVDLVRESRSTG
jgi:hypothetical protein